VQITIEAFCCKFWEIIAKVVCLSFYLMKIDFLKLSGQMQNYIASSSTAIRWLEQLIFGPDQVVRVYILYTARLG
jgi:hypothetical protein